MKIVQITGYQNSGKTSMMLELIHSFRSKGLKVATLKHHGHGGVPLGLETKDSSLHQQAGASIAGVEGEGIFQLVKEEPWKLDELIALYRFWQVDVLLLEGFKKADYEKIVLLRDEKDVELLQQVNNIIAVVATDDLEKWVTHYPAFHRDKPAKLAEWLMEHWKNTDYQTTEDE